MMRSIFLISGLLFLSVSKGQTFISIDIGGEYQRYSHGSIYDLQVALYTKMNHSVQLRAGYNKVHSHRIETHTEEGGGWGAGLGYRYFFMRSPSKFFAGIRLDAWKLNIDADVEGPAAGPAVYVDPVWMFHPAIETGYLFLLNKSFYFTPYITAGFHSAYSEGFKATAGISAGVRF
jgi:hypothetical protein